jgi:hypothetical protein
MSIAPCAELVEALDRKGDATAEDEEACKEDEASSIVREKNKR